MIYYVDVDETVCYYETERHYTDALPHQDRIERINRLYDAGHTLVYWTARGSQTGIDWTELTKKQLELWGAKHTELRLNKPNYDMFICDKAINSRDFFND